MSATWTFVRRIFRSVTGSIAFVPTLYVLGFVSFAVIMRILEFHGLSDRLGDKGYFWLVNSESTARTLLSTIIAGLISLTVFSFSMVMVVLSQATNTLSPRLLPEIIQDRSHQTVLGIYLGVICFAYLTLIAIVPIEGRSLPAFSVFICVVMAIFCLALFVYFISSISSRIQVDKITHRVYQEAIKDFDYWESGPSGWSLKGPSFAAVGGYPINAPESGYIDLPFFQELSILAAKIETKLILPIPRGEFVTKGTPLIYLPDPPSTSQLDCFRPHLKLAADGKDNFKYLRSIRHITEVAVKALSPGINDPGTALKSIDYLEDLLLRLGQLPNYRCYQAQRGAPLYFRAYSFLEIVSLVLKELRCYGKTDPMILYRLARLLISLQAQHSQPATQDALRQEMNALLEDGRNQLKNSIDRQRFEAYVKNRWTT